MHCKEIECIIPSYVKGEEEELSSVIEKHLAECSSCRDLAEFARNLSSSLKKIPVAEPAKDFLANLHTRIKENPIVLQVEKNEETVEVAEIKRVGSGRTSSALRQRDSVREPISLRQSLYKKIKTPAFLYAVAVHFLVLGLVFALYRVEYKASQAPAMNKDAQWLRFQAYNNVIQGTVNKANVIHVGSFAQEGEVYITQNSWCVQILKNPPLRGNYIAVMVKDGGIELPEALIQKYFKDREISILVFNNAIEVWSKSTLEQYIQEEVPFKPA